MQGLARPRAWRETVSDSFRTRMVWLMMLELLSKNSFLSCSSWKFCLPFRNTPPFLIPLINLFLTWELRILVAEEHTITLRCILMLLVVKLAAVWKLDFFVLNIYWGQRLDSLIFRVSHCLEGDYICLGYFFLSKAGLGLSVIKCLRNLDHVTSVRKVAHSLRLRFSTQAYTESELWWPSHWIHML